jgi:hypothetical protein
LWHTGCGNIRERRMMDRVVRALKLDATLYQEVDGDESMTREALIVVVAAALIGGLGAALGDRDITQWIIGSLIGAPIGLAIWSAIVLVVGKIFGGQADFKGLYRSLAYASSPTAAQAIPVVGGVLALWGIATSVVAVRESHQISTGQAVTTVLLPLIILFVIAAVVFGAVVTAFFVA